ncbi:MAG: DNA-binding protein [Candidatus Bathyarchaeota archaeon]|nr:DNA-binding protein [Candidatus Bathyarchaeota archaeon]
MTASAKRAGILKVILDSNAFFVPLEFKIDIFEGLKRLLNRNVEFVLLSPIKQELELLAGGDSPKIRKEALFALRLAEKCKYVVVEDSEKATTDDVIVRVAKSWDSPVFTNDRALRKRLRDISVPVIYVRQKSRLDIDGLIS